MPWYLRAFRRFWLISPFRVAIFSFVAGFFPFILAVQFSTIGDVVYYKPLDLETVCNEAAVAAGDCIAKQVGYAHAPNWWPSFMLLFPFGLFFAFESVQNTRKVVERMATNRMFAALDWSGNSDSIDPVIEKLWRTFFFIAAPLFVIILVVLVKDWWCVAHWPLMLEVPLGDVLESDARRSLLPSILLERLQASGCYIRTAHENDWSVATTFGNFPGLAPLIQGASKPSWYLSYAFTAYNYIFLALLLGLIFMYFGFVLALIIVVYGLNEGQYGFQLVLNLNSADERKRRGFESMEAIFRPCIFVTIMAFVMAFFMRIQNVYLRDTEYSTIYDFLLADITTTITQLFDIDLTQLFGWFTKLLQNLKKFFDFDQFSDPQSLLGAPAVLLMLFVVAAALAHILRKAVKDAQDRVVTGLNNPDTAPDVAAYFQLSEEEAKKRANDVESWPLSWPKLSSARRMIGLGVFCYVFYRVAFIWIGVVAARSIQGRWSEK